LVGFFLAFAADVYSQPTRGKIHYFKIEGISLSDTPEEIGAQLLNDGFKVSQRSNNRTIYQKSTADRKTKIVTELFSDTLTSLQIVSRKLKINKLSKEQKNNLAVEAKNAFLKAKIDLGFDDADCKSKIKKKGLVQGQCEANWEILTHANTASILFKPNLVKVTLKSQPFPASYVDESERILRGAKKAFKCFSSVDIESAESVYKCLQQREKIAKKERLTSVGSSFDSISLNRYCGDFTRNYSLSLRYAKSKYSNRDEFNRIEKNWWKDYFRQQKLKRQGRQYSGVAQEEDKIDYKKIPSCDVFAEVIELATGKPPRWSQCTSYKNDVKYFKKCVEGMMPELAEKSGDHPVSCEELQKNFRLGAKLGARDRSFKPDVPDCDYVMGVAKAWRKQ
jgi:hypothetical protein